MKKIIALILFSVCCNIVAAQPTYTLEQLKASALSHNIAMRTARLDIDAAAELRKEAFTKYFPSLSATGFWFNANKGMVQKDINLSEVIPSSIASTLSMLLPAEALAEMASPVSISMMKNGTIGAITATQPVFAGGQIVNSNKLARVGEEASKLQLQLSEQEVEKQTEQYYWQLVSLQEKTKTLDAVDSLLASIYKDVDVAVRAGVAMPNDKLQVQLRQNDIASKRLKLNNGISIIKLLLAQYCGLNNETFSVESSEMSDIAATVPEALASGTLTPSTLNPQLTILPEYQLLQKQVEAATLQKRLALGKQLPTVAVGAGYNYHNLLDHDHTFGMVFATLSVPISDWWGGSHAIKRKKLLLDKAKQQLTDNTQLLDIRAQKAANDVEEAQQQILLARKSIEQAGENLRMNRDYYQAGTSRMSDLLEAQMLYQQALDSRIDAIAEYNLKLLEYKQATGK